MANGYNLTLSEQATRERLIDGTIRARREIRRIGAGGSPSNPWETAEAAIQRMEKNIAIVRRSVETFFS